MIRLSTFVENKLIQISLIRPNLEDAKLMDYAMKTYGEFSLPGGIKKIKNILKHSIGKTCCHVGTFDLLTRISFLCNA